MFNSTLWVEGIFTTLIEHYEELQPTRLLAFLTGVEDTYRMYPSNHTRHTSPY